MERERARKGEMERGKGERMRARNGERDGERESKKLRGEIWRRERYNKKWREGEREV